MKNDQQISRKISENSIKILPIRIIANKPILLLKSQINSVEQNENTNQNKDYDQELKREKTPNFNNGELSDIKNEENQFSLNNNSSTNSLFSPNPPIVDDFSPTKTPHNNSNQLKILLKSQESQESFIN